MAIITTNGSFGATSAVTSTTLNAVADAATFVSGAVDGTSLELISGGSDDGKLGIKDAGVTTAKVADSSSKTTGVTFAKMQHISTAKVLGRTSASEGDVEEVDLLDQDDMSSNSATSVATQQSIKAYVDSSSIMAQRVRVSSTTQYDTTATMNLDNSIPLVTEGLQILTTSYTPASSSNKISVSFNGQLSSGSAAAYIILALFEGTVCKGACYFQQSSNGISRTSAEFEFSPAGAGAATYSIRVGGSSGTTYVNRVAQSSVNLGGLVETSMTIEEYAS